MIAYETIPVSITACPYGRINECGEIIMVGSVSCSRCADFERKTANVVICRMEENNVKNK